MKRTKNYLTDVTVIKGDEQTTKIELSYEDMPRTFKNHYDAFWWAVAFACHVYDAVDNIYSIQTSNENRKEFRKTVKTLVKWLRREHLDRHSLGGIFRYKTVTASVVRRKRLITITIGETENIKFNVELYKKGEENN